MILFTKTRARRYGITVLIVAGASGAQLLLWPYVRPAIFLLYFPAVVLASIYGSGIFAGWLSVLAAHLLFLPNVEMVASGGQVLRALIFLASVYLIDSIRRAETGAVERLMEGQELLKISEARTRSVLENAIDAVVAMDDEGAVSQWNSQAEAIFGLTREEVLGRKMSELIIPLEHREAHENGMKHYLRTGVGPVLNRRIEITALRKNGEVFPIELSITPIANAKEIEFYGFIRDISERKLAESKLEAAIRGRDEFISIASHELKTPITSLKLQFQMASRQIEKGDPRVFVEDSVRKRVGSVNRQLDRMNRLIEDMLDVARVATGKLHIERKRFDLSSLFLEATERFTQQLNAVGSVLEVEVEPGIFFVGDEYRLDQVISNLITNAIKYGSGSRINARLGIHGDRIRFSITDGGIGIAENDHARIFERFERAIGFENVSGLGLGLFITRQIVESLDGKIAVESDVGRGSTFTVDLPREELS